MKRICQIGVLALAASTLVACGGSENMGPATAPPLTVVAPASRENAFAGNFGTAFMAPHTSTPVTLADRDIVPLWLTTNPTAIG